MPFTDDFGNTAATAGALNVGGSVRATMTPYDTDWFKVDLQAGTTYVFAMSQPPDSYSSLMDLELSVVDANNTVLVKPEIGMMGEAPATQYTPAVSGSYYIAARFPGGAWYTGTSPRDYLLSAAVQKPDALSADIHTAGVLRVDSGPDYMNMPVFEVRGDCDWFKFHAEAGQHYFFNLPNGIGVPSTLTIYDANGQALPDQSVAADRLKPFEPLASGDYFVSVTSNRAGSYLLLATTGKDDYSTNNSSPGVLEAGGQVQGTLNYAFDSDRFNLQVTAGQTYALKLDHLPLHPEALSFVLKDEHDALISVSQLAYDKTADQTLTFTAATSGSYALLVSSPGASADEYGTYTLKAATVAAAPVDDYGNTVQGAGKLAIGTQLKGKLDYAGDVDLVKVTLQKDTPYQFDLQASASNGLNPLYKYALGLYDGNGASIGASADSLVYRASTGGDYYLAVRAASGEASATGGYTLAATTMPAPQLAGPVSGGGAPLNLNDALALDFTGKVTVVDADGIRLTDASGHQIALDHHAFDTAAYHLVLDPLAHLTPGASYTLDITPYAISDLGGNFFGSGLHHTFSAVAAVGAGTDGNDVLIGKANGAAIHGGAGIDTAVYAGNAASYKLIQRDGHAEVKFANGKGGADILDGVERLLFDDKSVALDIDGVGGKAYRLYQAAFDRAPDESGLGYWISNMDKGLSLQATAGFFVGSEEFGRRYGANLSDADFVTQLYNNVLHRAPDAAGHAYWLHDLQIGVARGNVLANFSESPENQAALIQVIGNGFSYIPYSV